MHLSLSKNVFKIHLGLTEKILAAKKKSLAIPFKHIKQVTTRKPIPKRGFLSEVRAPGTYLPRLVKAGTYHTRKGKEFWYVTRRKPYLVLDLKNETYARIVLTTHKNTYFAKKIKTFIR